MAIDYLVWESDEVIKKYLSGLRGAVPFAKEQIKIILDLISVNYGDKEFNFIDLGCGDGVIADAILDNFPNSKAILIDLSDLMIDTAKSRLDKYSNRCSFIIADFSKDDWAKNINNKINIVTSGFSIHHQPDENKYKIYKEIYKMLDRNGIFLHLERVKSKTEWLQEQFDRNFVDSIYELMKGEYPNKTKEELAKEFYYREDKAANILTDVETQCNWLNEIGFTDVDIYFKFYELAIFGGRKQIG